MNTITIRPIITEEDYDAALNRIDEIFEADPGTPEGEELHILSLLIKDYDDKHYPLPEADPVELIKVRMEDLGLKSKDLIPYFGDKSTVSKVLNRTRPLTLEMVRNIAPALSLPVDALTPKYELVA